MGVGVDPKFLTTLTIRRSAKRRKMWELFSELIFYSKVADQIFIIPIGFLTDFASVPRLPFAYVLLANTAQEAAVVHDWLYYKGLVSRKMADDVFLEAIKVMDALDAAELKEQGASGYMSFFQGTLDLFSRSAMWLGVRVGGWKAYNGYRKAEPVAVSA